MRICDILLVGVGGQGVLTIGDLLMRAAFAAGISASFCPTKGMAQRGGFVKAELRLGAEGEGPRIRPAGADLVVAMERSEALRALPYVKAGSGFLLYDYVWEPTGVQLGVESYPSLPQVSAAIESAAASLTVVRPPDLPAVEGRTVPANVFLLGVALGLSAVGDLVDVDTVEATAATRWPQAAALNRAAVRLGYNAGRAEVRAKAGSGS